MVSIKEPYLISSWQLANLAALFDGLLASTHVRVVKLSTHRRSDTGTIDVLCQHYLPMGLGITVAVSEDLQVREISYDNGTTILSDRGLDVYKAPSADGARPCRTSQIMYFEVGVKTPCQAAGAANVAPLRLQCTAWASSRRLSPSAATDSSDVLRVVLRVALLFLIAGLAHRATIGYMRSGSP